MKMIQRPSAAHPPDYDRKEVEASLATVVEAFHTISSEYEQLCTIVLHVIKVQVASVISGLPVIPFQSKKEKVKLEMKQEMGTRESTSEAPQVPETSQTSEVP